MVVVAVIWVIIIGVVIILAGLFALASDPGGWDWR